jgi:hypothetical protein
MDQIPVVYEWGNKLPPEAEKIDTNSVSQVVSWCRAFSGNERLPQDVALPLERCVVGCYQIGYLFNNLKCKDIEKRREYMSEGIASVIVHICASYEMMGRLTLAQLNYKTFNDIMIESPPCKDPRPILLNLSESAFKYQRWLLYNHMKRTKRWNEEEFKQDYFGIWDSCMSLANHEGADMGMGFAMCMSKIQDAEIRRH